MMKKISKIIIIFILIFSTNIKECNAVASITVPYVGNGSDGGEGANNNKTWTFHGNTYSCSWSYTVNATYYTNVYGYNKDGVEIINGSPTTEEKIAAGTAVELRIEEIKDISWNEPTVTLTMKKATYRCNCTKRKRVCSENGPIHAAISWFKMPFLIIGRECSWQDVYCDPKIETCDNCQICGGNDYPITDTTDSQYITCMGHAEEAMNAEIAAHKSTSYALRLPNSNDIEGSSNENPPITGKGGCYPTGPNAEICTYRYYPEAVCIDIKTSKVNYSDTKDTCKDGEIKIDNNGTRWNYFTPLNTKKNDEISLTMSYASQSALQLEAMCLEAINNNANYKDFIKDSNNRKLKGTIEEDKITVKDGCYFGTDITVTTKQNFYNEIEVDDSTTKLKGFNFYYKPIDINNPFPSGVGQKSLWKEWYDGSRLNPDISESYQSRTYTALNINVGEIRKFNKDNLYTSWLNMGLNGTSGFIDDTKYGILRKGIHNVYKLGCGPANSDWSECL